MLSLLLSALKQLALVVVGCSLDVKDAAAEGSSVQNCRSIAEYFDIVMHAYLQRDISGAARRFRYKIESYYKDLSSSPTEQVSFLQSLAHITLDLGVKCAPPLDFGLLWESDETYHYVTEMARTQLKLFSMRHLKDLPLQQELFNLVCMLSLFAHLLALSFRMHRSLFFILL